MTSSPTVNLLDLDAQGLVAYCDSLGEKPFRAKQLQRWIHQYNAADFDGMTDLAKSLREKLKGRATITMPGIVSDNISTDGTRKWLIDVGNSNAVEAVYIPEETRGTLCVSSQAGCAVNCRFCSTGKQGFSRNLTTGEIIGQLRMAEFALRATRGTDGGRATGGDGKGERVVTNVVMMGMGNLVMGDAPMAWRGPMATGALQQLLRNTVWPELDYLIVDMPPGTGDIQLTLAQTVPVSGSVIVTTPQDIALLDAKKGIELFRKVNIDVLGVVENMSTHTCSQCGHEEAIFGDHGGSMLAIKYDTELLGQLPLKLAIREHADSGKPSVAVDVDSQESQSYLAIAKKVAMRLWQNNQQKASPLFSESDD